MNLRTTPPPIARASELAPAYKPQFVAPRPGSWFIDRAHIDRPRCRYMQEFETEYADGFRAGFHHYGALLDTIDFAYVGGFPYVCPRPLGAPLDPKGPPPKLVLKLLMWLHPLMRQRVKRAAVVFEDRVWRADVRDFHEAWFPAKRSRLLAHQRIDLASLSDAALADQVDVVRAEGVDSMTHHFRVNPAYMIAVGDFLVHANLWTGASRSEILALFEGASPVSRDAADLVEAVAKALESVPSLVAEIREGGAAAGLIERLRTAEGELGEAARAWLDVVGYRIFTGFDLAESIGIELPNVLLAALRSGLDGRLRSFDPAVVDARIAALRARVPDTHCARFDQMFVEARDAYGLRDAHSSGDMWAMGVARWTLLEAGRRLAARGLIHAVEHVFELRHAQVIRSLRDAGSSGDGDPIDADELARYVEYRRSTTLDDAPGTLGSPAIPPPPAEWLPAPAARMARAVAAYLGSMADESEERSQPSLVRGLSASGGKHIGTARVVLEPGDFDRLAHGDVLIARITTPAYNVVLPLLGGVVTDRGGVLSHPAIVAREYGIPGVVGTRTATTMIPDGARVEIDGDAGTVRVLG